MGLKFKATTGDIRQPNLTSWALGDSTERFRDRMWIGALYTCGYTVLIYNTGSKIPRLSQLSQSQSCNVIDSLLGMILKETKALKGLLAMGNKCFCKLGRGSFTT